MQTVCVNDRITRHLIKKTFDCRIMITVQANVVVVLGYSYLTSALFIGPEEMSFAFTF